MLVFIQINIGDDILSKNSIYNYLGEDISDMKIAVKNPSFGIVDEYGIPHINWGNENDNCDKDGFDKKARPSDETDMYIIENYIIPKGTIICRYGNSRGRFTTVKGEDYELLALPYIKETIEYHEYKVSEDLTVDCYVTKGYTAAKFDSKGGGIQFKHKQNIMLECEDGFLKEDILWKQ